MDDTNTHYPVFVGTTFYLLHIVLSSDCFSSVHSAQVWSSYLSVRPNNQNYPQGFTQCRFGEGFDYNESPDY